MAKYPAKTRAFNTFRKLFRNSFCERMLSASIRKNGAFGAFAEKLVPPNYLYKPGSFRNVTVRGINLNVDIADYVGHYLFFGFRDVGYEKLFSLAHPDDVIVDIGANIGFTALSLSQIAGSKGKVYAFEPDPYNFGELKKNVSLNKNLDVRILNMGLGEKKERLKLAIYESTNRGMNRVDNAAEHNFTWIEIDALDQFVKENNIPKISLIKIDTEGFEYSVLSGCKTILAEYRPALFIELDDNNLRQQQRSAKELIQLLEAANYTVVHSMTNQPVRSTDDLTNKHFDIICTA